jgi:hypothetical protein
MTEAEWLRENTNAQKMVLHVSKCGYPRTKVGRRKLRLFACGCCRQIWSDLPDPRTTHAIETAELFADGKAVQKELDRAGKAIQRLTRYYPGKDDLQISTANGLARTTTLLKSYDAALGVTMYPLPLAGYFGTPTEESALVCNILRDIFGNPFRPVTIIPEWRTSTVLALAQGIYDEKAFDRMPILADTLQDAGCSNEDILNHCRGPGPHTRGCFVVDLILGKE